MPIFLCVLRKAHGDRKSSRVDLCVDQCNDDDSPGLKSLRSKNSARREAPTLQEDID